jgi:hypothetical protein
MIDDIIDPEEREEQPLEPRLAEAARAYNPPPATPREAMWARIAEARAAARTAPTVAPAIAPIAPVTPATRVVSIDAARARRRPVRTWAILAGTLAAGIALGIFGGRVLKDGTQPPAVVANDPGTVRPSTPTIDSGSTPRVANADQAPATLEGSGPKKPPVGPIAPQRGTERVADRGAPPNTNAPRDRDRTITPRTRDEAFPPAGNSLYHAAAVQTLSQAEALLVAWRVDAPRDTAAARQLGTWARDVLGSTRLLLDSPAASDPRLRSLLDDLELVLAQIVQLSGAPLTDAERALLERSVRDRDLLPRIRSAVPAGVTGSATSI